MSDRERKRRLDLFAMQFADALEAGDFTTLDRLWAAAATDPELEEVLLETAEALAETYDAEVQAHVGAAVVEAVERHMPSAEVMRPVSGPLTVGEVAEFIRRHPPGGLTTDEIGANDQLRESAEVVPADLGMSHVVHWGQQFGSLPEAYWRAFRQAALKLRMRQESDVQYQMAARQATRRRPEAKP
jgi:hypothetical protein